MLCRQTIQLVMSALLNCKIISQVRLHAIKKSESDSRDYNCYHKTSMQTKKIHSHQVDLTMLCYKKTIKFADLTQHIYINMNVHTSHTSNQSYGTLIINIHKYIQILHQQLTLYSQRKQIPND